MRACTLNKSSLKTIYTLPRTASAPMFGFNANNRTVSQQPFIIIVIRQETILGVCVIDLLSPIQMHKVCTFLNCAVLTADVEQ